MRLRTGPDLLGQVLEAFPAAAFRRGGGKVVVLFDTISKPKMQICLATYFVGSASSPAEAVPLEAWQRSRLGPSHRHCG
jgi:hypothetical protein